MRDVEKATLVKNSILLSNSNIKNKHGWMTGQKKLPKTVDGIDKMYMTYVARNTILLQPLHFLLLFKLPFQVIKY